MSQESWYGGNWLEDKNAIITGGTSGIGFAIAQLFCRHGARVVIAGRTKAKGEKAEHNLRGIGNGAIYKYVDVAKITTIHDMVEESANLFDGRIDVLVNNAGVLHGGGITTLTSEEWTRVNDVNVRGAALCVKAVIPFMKQSGGSIINTSSVAANAGTSGQIAYAGSKGALEAVTFCAASELALYNIRVNAIAPGLVDTTMTAGMQAVTRGDILSRTSLHRAATPEEIAGAYLFFASDASRFITGQVLHADGGRNLSR